MSFKGLALFAAFMFALALFNSPPAAACDTGGGVAGNPTFSFTAPQPVYSPQAFVAAPVVTQQFVAQPQYVQQFVNHPPQAFVAVNRHHAQALVAQPVAVQAVRQPRRQVTRSATVTRTGGILGLRN